MINFSGIRIDGQAVLCEAKSSWRSLRLTDIEKFVSLARRLRPDIALLAVMEQGTGPEAELAIAQKQLADEGIAFELLTPSEHDEEEAPYL